MVIDITNRCFMMCSHCMNNSSPDGEHMTGETFEKVLDFLKIIKPTVILVGGGEPTEHPEFDSYVIKIKNITPNVMLLSNGMFLENRELKKRVKDLKIKVQITNDARYYPKKIKYDPHNAFIYEDNLQTLFPAGRAITNNITPNRYSPGCFNLRSIATKATDLRSAIKFLESNFKFCIPSIYPDGSIRAGENINCFKIGKVSDSVDNIFQNLKTMQCDNCGLFSSLSPIHKQVLMG